MSQSMPVVQNQPPSMQAQQLAETYQLGTPQEEYSVRLTRMTLFCGIASLVLAAGFGFFAYTLYTSPQNVNDTNNAPFGLGIGVGFLLGALYCLLYPLLYCLGRVLVYFTGFAFHSSDN